MSVDRHLSFGSISTPALPSRSLTSTPAYYDIDHPTRGPFTDSSDYSEKTPGSPSSGMTVRNMSPSLRPVVGDDDIFAPNQHQTRTLRRRSSRLSKWLQELRSQSPTVNRPHSFNISPHVKSGPTECNPYLAYPHLSISALRRSMDDDATSMHDYVLVDEHDAQDFILPDQSSHLKLSHPSSPLPHPSTRQSPIRLINTSPSHTQFNPSLGSASPPPSSASRSPSRLSIFQRSSHATSNSDASNHSNHSPSFSLPTSHPIPQNHSQQSCVHSTSSSWRWRPSVLGHFPSLSDAGTRSSIRDSPGSSSRPSMSSTTTTTSSYATQSTNIMYDDGVSLPPSPSTPTKSPFLDSLRSRSQKAVTTSLSLFKSDTTSHSSPNLFSLSPTEQQRPYSTGFPSPLARKSSTLRVPFSQKSKATPNSILPFIFVEEPDATRPHAVYTSKSHPPRVSLSSIGSQSRSTKKKLVISGIALNDAKRLEAVQKWCQSFGEVDQITRMPNGDLEVKFRKAEVADTVCRVRAKVYIAGVGSVHLSWYSGNRRP